MPLYLLYLSEALRDLWTRQLRFLGGRFLALGTALAMAAAIPGAYRTVTGPLEDGIHTQTYRESIAFIRTHTDPQARIVSDSARYLALLTDRPSLFFPLQSTDAGQYARFFRRMKADYLLLSKHHQESRPKLEAALALFPQREVVFENAEYALFRLGPPAVQ